MKKIYSKSCLLFVRNSFLIFLKIFKYFFNFFPNVTRVLLNFTFLQNFSPKFSKNYNMQNFSVFQNFTKNFGILISVSTYVLQYFFTVFSKFLHNWLKFEVAPYICLQNPTKKTVSFLQISLTFFNNLFNKCLQSYLRGWTEIIIQGRAGSLKMAIQSLSY